jgi:hypothetical protein
MMLALPMKSAAEALLQQWPGQYRKVPAQDRVAARRKSK